MRKITVPLILLLTALLSLSAVKDRIRRAPDFTVRSGDRQVMTLAGLKPYRLTVCFYESREAVDLNRDFKERLRSLYLAMDEQTRGRIFILSVGDCTAARWPLIALWEAALVEKSKKNGWTVYGDWDGSMAEAYSFHLGDSNFALVDSDGFILYQTSGLIGPEEAVMIENLILQQLEG